MSAPPVASVRPATAATTDELLELLQAVRRELRLRGEDFQGSWVESAAEELRAGRQPGWYVPPRPGHGGLAFGNVRDRRSWAHVHAVEPGEARALADALVLGLEPGADTVTVGFSGLTADAERRLLDELSGRAGSEVIERYCMVRGLRPDDANTPPPLPDALERVRVRDVTPAALTDLDWRAFRGSIDDRLVGGSPEEYGRVLRGVLDNSLGLFLDGASTTLVQSEPTRLVAGILTAEVSPHEAVFLDLMVDPDFRRRGLGRWLLRWALRALLGLGYDRVRLWVTARNETALRLYEAEGFRRVAATRLYRWERGSDGPQPQRSR